MGVGGPGAGRASPSRLEKGIARGIYSICRPRRDPATPIQRSRPSCLNSSTTNPAMVAIEITRRMTCSVLTDWGGGARVRVCFSPSVRGSLTNEAIRTAQTGTLVFTLPPPLTQSLTPHAAHLQPLDGVGCEGGKWGGKGVALVGDPLATTKKRSANAHTPSPRACSPSNMSTAL
jgi:hypothetical protein